MKLTADTITDNQIRELLEHVSKTPGVGASDRVYADCGEALSAPMGSLRRANARARCADLLNTMSNK